MEIAWPARSAFKFGFGVEKGGAATDAGVDAVVVMVPVKAGEGRLGCFSAGNVVLAGAQVFSPVAVRATKGGEAVI